MYTLLLRYQVISRQQVRKFDQKLERLAGEFNSYTGEDYILDDNDARKVHLNSNGIPVVFSLGQDKEIIGLLDKNLKIKK